MTPITQIRYEGLHMTYLKCHVEIDDPRYLSCDLRKLNGCQLEFGEGGRLGMEDTWQIMSTHPNSNWIEFVDGLVTLEG